MAIKKQGILAHVGEFKFGDRTEIKTASELKKAVERQPIIMLTHGHPAGHLPTVSDYIGTVSQKWNEEKQRVDGDFWFYDEHIPEHIRERIVNDRPVKISAGYSVDRVEEGIQKGILYSHIAVLNEEADPKCPLDKCGVNVRMESNSEIRYEQAQDIDKPEEPEKETVKPAPTSVTFTDEQFKQLLETIRPVVPEPPVVEETKVEEATKEVPEEPSAPTPPEPRMEPEKVIPRGTAPSEAEYATNDDTVAVSIQMLGKNAKK